MEAILWDLLYAGVFCFIIRCAWSGMHHEHRRGHDGHFVTWEPVIAKDPVCGMSVASDSGFPRVYDGDEYWFCSRECRARFEQNPDRYIDEEEERIAS